MFQTIAAVSPNISIAPEIIFHIGAWPITNSQVLGFFGIGIIIALFFAVKRGVLSDTGTRFVHGMMMLVENLYDTTIEVIGDKKTARKVFPFALTLFFFFLINNWLGLLPVVGSITYHGEPLLRGLAADLNTTFALAIVSMVTVQVWAVKKRGFFGNLHRYFVNPLKSPLHFAEGLLEVVAELSRTAALAFRIFGNVFGGEVLLGVIAFLTSWAAPLALPVFYGLEVFVGAVQAYVFFMLTIAFISLGLPQDGEHAVEGDPIHATPKAELAGNGS